MYSNYGYNYGSYSTASNLSSYDTLDSTGMAVLGGVAIAYLIVYAILMLVCIAISVVEIIAMWKMFKKAGRHGWEAIIPFYNMYTLFEISGLPGSKIFFMFIPFAGPIILLVYEIKAAISLSKKFHKPGGFAALLILVSVVGYCILGFGKDKYDGKLGLQR